MKFELAAARQPRAADEPSEEVLALRHMVKSLRAQVSALQATAKPRPPPPPSEQEAKLRAKIRQLRTELREVARTDQRTALVPAADRRAILRVLHPDFLPGEPSKQKLLTRASQAFNNIKIKVIKADEVADPKE